MVCDYCHARQLKGRYVKSVCVYMRMTRKKKQYCEYCGLRVKNIIVNSIES